MAIETERKFIISGIPPDCAPPLQIRQGYLQTAPHCAVRIRITQQENQKAQAYLTIKGPTENGQFSRQEYEYEISLEDAVALLTLCEHNPIEKKRYHFEHEGHLWELDQFEGANTGLLMAEIELENEDTEFSCPSFVEKEVTGDPRYFNLQLAIKPYNSWK